MIVVMVSIFPHFSALYPSKTEHKTEEGIIPLHGLTRS